MFLMAYSSFHTHDFFKLSSYSVTSSPFYENHEMVSEVASRSVEHFTVKVLCY